MSSTSTTREPSDDGLDSRQSSSLIRRSWHVMHDMFTPFSSTALASLPAPNRPVRYHRADAIPDAPSGDDGQRPNVRDYHAITSLPPQVRVPKKIPTSVKVEAKVWFANERTWVAWLNIAVIIGTLALALFNASKDKVATYFAYAYALISICVVVYAFFLYQYRITMIRRRDPGHFDAVTGPVVLGVALFVAVLLNFIIRVREFNRKVIPIPGPGLYSYTQNNSSPLSFHTQA